MRPLHSINVPEGASGIALARDGPPDPGGVVGAIRTHATTLRTTAASPAEKRAALTVRAHVVGDALPMIPGGLIALEKGPMIGSGQDTS